MSPDDATPGRPQLTFNSEQFDLIFRRIALWMPVPLLAAEAFVFHVLGKVRYVYADMLGGKPLPGLTEGVLWLCPWFYVLPLLAVFAAVAFTVRKPSPDLTLCLVVTAYTAAFVIGGIFLLGLGLPMFSIISGMQQQS